MIDTKQISGPSYTATFKNGKWHPTRIDLASGDTTLLLFGFDDRDAAIDYAMDNFRNPEEVAN